MAPRTSCIGLSIVCILRFVPEVCAELVAENASGSSPQYGGSTFWDELYTASEREGLMNFSHPWQGVGLASLTPMLEARLSRDASLLILGCGDSQLPEELLNAGWRNVTAVDISSKVIKQKTSGISEGRPGLKWLCEDAAALSFSSSSFDGVLELGLLDSLAADGEEAPLRAVGEAYRVLRDTGTFFSVSTEPPLYRAALFNGKAPRGWTTEVSSLPRQRAIDERIRALDPPVSLGDISVYASSASAAPKPMASEAAAMYEAAIRGIREQALANDVQEKLKDS
mmetsp:Transcript_45057/g.97850  ORF Transcript_45057/g.97850 Transcript_45057/m.97850 type:complete len:283 (-) Transcript_45057:385-1233(-)|eukprot:CAMPEP_0170587048 /NCGR_PEP_ID=MMETSP0224-20130122/10074_1 /TAXON_ID=285029 /ORGANISM="Togula jolla, Strain CCCM 725" /LENGTH=282 /DNA_ID=CAMNT_0010910643 /DNA_START=119 /DNA_END=967 /DNA_ORIENTATION=+